MSLVINSPPGDYMMSLSLPDLSLLSENISHSAVLASTLVVALAEIGDKTQLLSLLLAIKFRNKLAIVMGILVATLLNHAASAWLGVWLGESLNSWMNSELARWLLAGGFIAMALWILIPDKEDDDTDTRYPERFFDAFGTTEITEDYVVMAIAQFLRTMVSADSKFDRWRRGEVELTDSEYSGYQIFLREGGDPEEVPGGQFGGDCFHCHGEAGLQFTDHLFHNNGLDPSFEADPGRALVTGSPLDSGLFRTPTLRNVALSAPYMHDGRFQTLEEVLEHYNSGGVPSSTIDPFMKYTTGGLSLAPSQKADLLAFLHTLTDTSFVQNPDFQNPH